MNRTNSNQFDLRRQNNGDQYRKRSDMTGCAGSSVVERSIAARMVTGSIPVSRFLFLWTRVLAVTRVHVVLGVVALCLLGVVVLCLLVCCLLLDCILHPSCLATAGSRMCLLFTTATSLSARVKCQSSAGR